MPGGYGNIKPSDNTKPFTSDYNGSDFEKWTEEKIHNVLDRLQMWMLEEIEVKDKDGNITYVDKGNCFYREFLYKENLFTDWITYVSQKFTTVSNRVQIIDSIQEDKLQWLAARGKHKEGITRFILQNKYNWSEKKETKNEIISNLNIKDIVNFKNTNE